MNVDFNDDLLKQIIDNTPARLDDWLNEVSVQIKDDIVNSFGISPSAPGDPPGVDTGNLRDGMDQTKVGDLSYVVFAQAEYAPFLEFGTERMAKRPFFTPVIEDWRRYKLLESALQADLVRE